MNNLKMILIDCDDYFFASNDKCDIKIDYGLYSLMVGSINYQKTQEGFNSASFQEIVEHIAFLRYKIKDLKRRGVPVEVLDKYYKDFYNDISSLYKPICSLVDTGHFNQQQLLLVMKLFMDELTMYFKSEDFDYKNIWTYTPSILKDIDLKKHIHSLLLNNKDNLLPLLQERMEHTKLTITNTTFNNISRTVYNITSTTDFLLTDLPKCLSSKKKKKIKVKECLCCERLFYASNGTKYCRLPHKDTDKLCAYIMHHRPKDELEYICNKAKRSQNKKRNDYKNKDKYGDIFMYNIYVEWLQECNIRYAKARNNNDTEGFKNWIEETKFSKERLSSLYEKYKNETDKTGENE